MQNKLSQTRPSIISTWIKRGVPKEFENILAKASIDVEIWREIIENVNVSDLTEQTKKPIPETKEYEKAPERPANHPTNSHQSAYNINAPAQPTFDDYMEHTSDILQSPSIFSTALKSNIEAFYFGLRINKDLDAAHNLLRQHAQLLEAQNQTINNLNSKIDHLEVENKNLKNNNDNQEERIKAIEERLLALNALKSA